MLLLLWNFSISQNIRSNFCGSFLILFDCFLRWVKNFGPILTDQFDSRYYLEYLDYLPHLYCYTHNVSADMSFGLLQVFHVELRSPYWISNRDWLFQFWVQILSYSKYSLLFSPVVEIDSLILWFWFSSYVIRLILLGFMWLLLFSMLPKLVFLFGLFFSKIVS